MGEVAFATPAEGEVWTAVVSSAVPASAVAASAVEASVAAATQKARYRALVPLVPLVPLGGPYASGISGRRT